MSSSKNEKPEYSLDPTDPLYPSYEWLDKMMRYEIAKRIKEKMFEGLPVAKVKWDTKKEQINERKAQADNDD